MNIRTTIVYEQLLEAYLSKYRRALLEGGTASSKCLGRGTRVVMADLTLKAVEDIAVDDVLMGIDGKPRRVLSLYRGQDDLYKIKQARGIDYIVSSNHILSLRECWKELRRNEPKGKRVYIGHTNPYTVINISLQNYLQKGYRWRRRHKGWKLAGVELPERKVLVEPYFLGLWLGDGTRGNTNITNSDKEIIDYLKWFAVRNNLTYGKIKDDKYGHTLVRTTRREANPLRKALRDYGIFEDKRIPKEYLNNSRQVRLELLAGLIDSDGFKTNKGGMFAINQTKKELAEDILLLVRSLGCYATFNKYIARMKRNDGSVYETNVYYVAFVGEALNEVPVKLERKRSKTKFLERRYSSAIEVEPLGIGDYFGFELSGDFCFY